MKQRTLAGRQVSAIGLGAMPMSMNNDKQYPTHEDAIATVHAALDAGVTLIDTADCNAPAWNETGVNERIVAEAIRTWSGDTSSIFVATKGGITRSEGEVWGRDGSATYLRQAVARSLENLGVDAIDLYQAHGFDPHTPLEETLRTFDGFIRTGKIRYYGLSNFTGWQLTKAVHLAGSLNLATPITLQPQYNLLVREIEWEIVPAALDAGLGLLPWSPLGGGWLSGKYRRNERPAGATRLGEDPGRGMEAYDKRNDQDRTWDVIDAVQTIADARGVSMAQVALSWVTNRPAVTSTILGARTLTQLDDNLAAAGLQLEPTEIETLDRASRLPVGDYPYGELGVEQRERNLAGGRG